MSCPTCVLKCPYDHAEPWQCPDCGLWWAVPMPGVKTVKLDALPAKPAWMTPEREEAIELLLCAADVGSMSTVFGAASATGAADQSLELARVAWLSVDGWLIEASLREWERTVLLEAAGLLLDGWNPGDEVVRRTVFDVPLPSEVAAYLNGPSFVTKLLKAGR